MLSGGGGNEPGDPRKGAERIILLVQQQVLPMRFALGVSTSRIELLHAIQPSEVMKCLYILQDDGWDLVVQSHVEIVDGYRRYETLSKGTNRDGLEGSDGAVKLKERFAS